MYEPTEREILVSISKVLHDIKEMLYWIMGIGIGIILVLAFR
jgi:hypothetical protein